MLRVAIAILIVVSIVIATHGQTRSPGMPQPPDLSGMSNAELVEYFRESGLAIEDQTSVPTDRTPFARSSHGRTPEHYEAIQEITRRGEQMVPLVLGELVREVPIQRMHPGGQVRISMTRELCEMLARIGSVDAVETLIQIVDGFDEKAHADEQWAALDALEQLTYRSFRAFNTVPYWSVADPEVRLQPDKYQEIARAYLDFIDEHGFNRSRWLRVAEAQARAHLDSDRIELMYPALQFLAMTWSFSPHDPPIHDSELQRTADRLVEIINSFVHEDGEWHYLARDGERGAISSRMWNFVDRASVYGPRLRGAASKLIEIQRVQGLDEWSMYRYLGTVGGNEIMSFLMESMREIERETSEFTAEIALPGDDPRLRWRSAERDCRLAIQRWAGRVFESAEEREAWWVANRHRTEEEWLREGLPIAAQQTAQRSIEARTILFWTSEYIAGELGRLEAERLPPQVDYVGWVERDLPRSIYDPHRGIFVTPADDGP